MATFLSRFQREKSEKILPNENGSSKSNNRGLHIPLASPIRPLNCPWAISVCCSSNNCSCRSSNIHNNSIHNTTAATSTLSATEAGILKLELFCLLHHEWQQRFPTATTTTTAAATPSTCSQVAAIVFHFACDQTQQF